MTPAPIPPIVVPAPTLAAPAVLASAFSAFFGPGSARRYLIGIPTMLLLGLNNKLGLGLDTAAQAIIASIALGMITGSNIKEAVVAHSDAKVAVAQAENQPLAGAP